MRSQDREVTIQVTDSAVSAFRKAGDVVLKWNAITKVTERGGMTRLQANEQSIVLAIRADERNRLRKRKPI